MSTIHLHQYQIPHVEAIKHIHKFLYGALDTSEMGAGKTITSLYIAKTYSFPSVIVIGPSSLEGRWLKESKRYGVHLEFYTYSATRGSRFPYLTCNDGVFRVTQSYKDLVNAGILLIFDEISNLKNDSSQTKASHALTQALVMSGGSSRILALAAIPIDKPIQAEFLLRTLGVITYKKLYDYDQESKIYTLTGLQQVIDMAIALDPITTADIVPDEINRGNASRICYELFVHVLRDSISSNMDMPPVESDISNAYFKMNEEEYQKLIEGVMMLKDAVRFTKDGATIDKSGFGQLTPAMIKIEEAKCDVMVRQARIRLEHNPQCKVILYLNYKNTIEYVAGELDGYHPLVLTGDVKMRNRDSLIDKFQEPNARYRVLIANTQVGGVGLNLDDTNGNWPRYMFIIPTYHFINVNQATRRATRATSRSAAVIYLVYGRDENVPITGTLSLDSPINSPIGNGLTIPNSSLGTSTETPVTDRNIGVGDMENIISNTNINEDNNSVRSTIHRRISGYSSPSKFSITSVGSLGSSSDSRVSPTGRSVGGSVLNGYSGAFGYTSPSKSGGSKLSQGVTSPWRYSPTNKGKTVVLKVKDPQTMLNIRSPTRPSVSSVLSERSELTRSGSLLGPSSDNSGRCNTGTSRGTLGEPITNEKIGADRLDPTNQSEHRSGHQWNNRLSITRDGAPSWVGNFRSRRRENFGMHRLLSSIEQDVLVEETGSSRENVTTGSRNSSPPSSGKKAKKSKSLPIGRGEISDVVHQNLEQSIFDALARKSDVARSSLTRGDSVKFPGEYPIYIEV